MLGWGELDVQAEVAEIMAKYPNDPGAALGWYGGAIVELGVKRQLGTQLHHLLQREENPVSPAQGLVILKKEMTREAMQLARRGNSRSTSQWSNLAEDAKREALFELLEGYGATYAWLAAEKLLVLTGQTLED